MCWHLLAANNPIAFYYADWQFVCFVNLYLLCCFCLAIIRRTSKIPGVLISQCVTELPDGASTPDFQCKVEPISISEGGPRLRRPLHLSWTYCSHHTVVSFGLQEERLYLKPKWQGLQSQRCHGDGPKEHFQTNRSFRVNMTNPLRSTFCRWVTNDQADGSNRQVNRQRPEEEWKASIGWLSTSCTF